MCKDNNISYFGCGGTAIGAVRHHGLIPWDDDIDVYMLRKDYKRFLQLKERLVDSQYEIVDIKNEGYYLPFAKFMDSKTTIWEQKKYPFIIGVFIDIFPLDCAYEDLEKTEKLHIAYKNMCNRYIGSMAKYDIKDLLYSIYKLNFHVIKSIAKTWLWSKWNSKRYKSNVLAMEEKITSISGNSYLYYGTIYNFHKGVFPKEWFETSKVVPFEDTDILLCGEYDHYLNQQFGDYMELPPVEQRISHHYHYLIDLSRRWSDDEVRRYDILDEQNIEYTCE